MANNDDKKAPVLDLIGGSKKKKAAAPQAAPAPRANSPYGSAPQGGGFVQVDEEDLPF